MAAYALARIRYKPKFGNIYEGNAVEDFGSSESSILPIGTGNSITAPGWTMAAILGHAGPGPLFVKIDVEGYEYALKSEFSLLFSSRLRGVQLAIHPGLFARTQTGPALWRRVRAAWATWHLARQFNLHLGRPAIHKHRSLWRYILSDILLNPTPRGTDLVYERR